MSGHRSLMTHPMLRLSGLAMAAWLVGTGQAKAVEVDFSGFASVIAGQTFGSCQPSGMAPQYQKDCTRYIADWSHAGVYTPQVSLAPESRLGLQWTAKVNAQLSATLQLTARDDPGNKVHVEWAYLNYDIDGDWSVQLGRKRLPLYYYSEFQDVGYAYNTIRPSPDVYGWDVVNYNGANLRHVSSLGAWSLREDVFAGTDTERNDPYYRLNTSPWQNASWSNILGASVELNHDWFTTRVSYVQSDFEQFDTASARPVVQPSGGNSGRQSFYGIGMAADYENWVLRAEYDMADRSAYAYFSHFYLANVGYHFGKWTPTVGLSHYAEGTRFTAAYQPTHDTTTTATVRYELSDKSDLKLQVDHLIDHSQVPFMGSANLVSISYDTIF